ncbi:hypothetical protein KP509_37G067800 [Ceratopteris richardii]|uniref:BSD domain-containing protein n=1 Tax=Ceratopteris richardii TaxID=49495 RepID=A0A8T2QB38_CERRI|nr:hypothetical protein KP509_37G067800 [Ceratopteris richardii]
MDSSFFVKAKNAFHSAASRAERVLAEFKEDIGRSATTTIRSGETVDELSHSITCQSEQQLQEKLYECILNISNDPEKKFLLELKTAGDMPCEFFKDDDDLQNLRFSYVPKKMKEHDFWKYYSIAVERVKQNVSFSSILASNNGDCRQDKLAPESPMKDPVEEDAYATAVTLTVVPSSKLLRKLAAVIEIGRSAGSIKDLVSMKAERDLSQSAGALVSGMKAMKNSFLRENKELKSSEDEELQACLQSLFESDTQQHDFNVSSSKLAEDIHGAPPASFVSHLAEIMGSLRTHQRMAELWCRIIPELRHHWEGGVHIPRLPVDEEPDLRYCPILQKLQVINCCIARKKRHMEDLSFLDALDDCLQSRGSPSVNDMEEFVSILKSKVSPRIKHRVEANRLFACGKDGQVLQRLGADFPAPSLMMLETGQQIYAPLMQEGQVLTEDLIKEKEELVLRTGSVGAGCSQLLSDMQAFKAANPGCILEDFVRWYSPPDWCRNRSLESSTQDFKHDTESRGYLSARMQSHGNLWQELWLSAKPIPAARQSPLFDEELAVESILSELEIIKPTDLFEQLFKALLGVGFTIAETSPTIKGKAASEKFMDYKNFVTSLCSEGMTLEELEQLCQVYEIMEVMLQFALEETKSARTLDVLKNQDYDSFIEEGSRNYSSFIVVEKGVYNRSINGQKCADRMKTEQNTGLFSLIREAKASLFEKRHSHITLQADNGDRVAGHDSEWTVL